ncbi:hypothetical protein AFCDBAGC_1276 [Methylobacterium cerastii]|uniref:DNA-directed RNA polymerase II n=1 Tax=Methylobacterium cerastii TaxID=932741 RepID=A0ABQ4QDX8_9HYPH|nr:hypothetical protein AFCDBAGC_1276 [Methylobacterium cerastii]
MLAPDSVSVPVPAWLSAIVPAALPSRMIPEKVVAVFRVPAVSVAPALPLLVTLPAPASDPIVCEKPPRSRVAPVPTETALFPPKLLVVPPRSVPAKIVVAPV